MSKVCGEGAGAICDTKVGAVFAGGAQGGKPACGSKTPGSETIFDVTGKVATSSAATSGTGGNTVVGAAATEMAGGALGGGGQLCENTSGMIVIALDATAACGVTICEALANGMPANGKAQATDKTDHGEGGD